MTEPPLPEESIFARAQDLPPAERAAFLDGACGDDPPLRAAVEALLRADGRTGDLLDVPDARPTSLAGTDLAGRYRLQEVIGEGGMGTVWAAEQREPVKRPVAVKLVKPGMDSDQVLARFEAERQALALMDHPNIARVYDAGATADGRPYFVMELVRGVPITRFCDEHRLTPRQRLELFVPVCQAIQHAHQKGVIHRDIKPSNVLVARYDDRPVPKVIDFGVAKATGSRLTDQTLHTGLGTVVGTVEYMSPEQASLDRTDVDTRSDVYSLGVLLYELLAGSPPFTKKELERAGVLEMLRVIREQEPSKPSTKLSTADGLPTLAANRGTEPARLAKLVRGELDWIVMKAMEKDRDRRYATANGFAMDVLRYLADEPVSAGPPSATYRLRKLMRRNRTAVLMAAVGLFVLVLLGGAAGWTVRDRELRRAQLAAQANLILGEVRQHEADQNWPAALAAARRAEALVVGAGGDAELEGPIRLVLGDLKLVERLEAIRIQRDRPYKTEPFTVWADGAYSAAFRDAGLELEPAPPDGAFERFRERPAVAMAVATALDDWGFCQARRQNAAGAVALWTLAQRLDPDPWRGQLREAMVRKDALAIEELAAAPDLTRQPPAALYLLFLAHYLVDKPEQALAVLRKANWQYPDDFWSTYWLGNRLRALGPAHRDEAARYSRTAVALRPHSSWAWHTLGYSLEDREQWEEALAVYRRVQTLEPTSVWAHLDAGRTLTRLGRDDEALASYWTALECDTTHVQTRGHLFYAVRDRKDRGPVAAFFRAVNESDPRTALAHYYLGSALWWDGKPAESLAPFEKAVALAPHEAEFRHSLANNLRRLDRTDEAIAAYEQAIHLGLRDDWLHYEYGLALRKKGRLADAIRSWKTSVEINPARVQSHRSLAWHLATAADPALRDPKAAVVHGEKAVDLDSDTPQHWSNLGVAQWRAGDLRVAVETLEQANGKYPDGDMYHRFFLAMAYRQTGEVDKARTAYEQGVRWAEKNRPMSADLRRFRAEAEDVLKVGKK